MLTDMRSAIGWVQDHVKLTWCKSQEVHGADPQQEPSMLVMEDQVQLRGLPGQCCELRIPLGEAAWHKVARVAGLPWGGELAADQVRIAFISQVISSI